MKRQLKKLVRSISKRTQRVYLSFGSAVKCPLCGWTGSSFLRKPYPDKPADGYACPSCKSSERHRLAYLTLKDRLASHADKTLHVAPEKCIEPWLRAISKDYLSIDLASASAMAHMDITDLRLENDSFSLVWCSHVLEHVEEDRKAMAEFFRVLRPSGVAVIMVPVYGEKTYEKPDAKSPEERLKHFKNAHHVRIYGLDMENRLREAGFKVDVLRVSDMPAESVTAHVLDYPSTREIFFCTK